MVRPLAIAGMTRFSPSNPSNGLWSVQASNFFLQGTWKTFLLSKPRPILPFTSVSNSYLHWLMFAMQMTQAVTRHSSSAPIRHQFRIRSHHISSTMDHLDCSTLTCYDLIAGSLLAGTHFLLFLPKYILLLFNIKVCLTKPLVNITFRLFTGGHFLVPGWPDSIIPAQHSTVIIHYLQGTKWHPFLGIFMFTTIVL